MSVENNAWKLAARPDGDTFGFLARRHRRSGHRSTAALNCHTACKLNHRPLDVDITDACARGEIDHMAYQKQLISIQSSVSAVENLVDPELQAEAAP